MENEVSTMAAITHVGSGPLKLHARRVPVLAYWFLRHQAWTVMALRRLLFTQHTGAVDAWEEGKC